MTRIVPKLALMLALVVSLAALPLVASAQEQTTDASPAMPPPPEATPVAPQAQGQWIETAAYGWVWVPADSTTYVVGAQPYAYLYTPVYGWTWYVSPWGAGRFYVGSWAHEWRGSPHVWTRGRWIATPARVAPSRVIHVESGHPIAPSHAAAHGGGGHGGHR